MSNINSYRDKYQVATITDKKGEIKMTTTLEDLAQTEFNANQTIEDLAQTEFNANQTIEDLAQTEFNANQTTDAPPIEVEMVDSGRYKFGSVKPDWQPQDINYLYAEMLGAILQNKEIYLHKETISQFKGYLNWLVTNQYFFAIEKEEDVADDTYSRLFAKPNMAKISAEKFTTETLGQMAIGDYVNKFVAHEPLTDTSIALTNLKKLQGLFTQAD